MSTQRTTRNRLGWPDSDIKGFRLSRYRARLDFGCEYLEPIAFELVIVKGATLLCSSYLRRIRTKSDADLD